MNVINNGKMSFGYFPLSDTDHEQNARHYPVATSRSTSSKKIPYDPDVYQY